MSQIQYKYIANLPTLVTPNQRVVVGDSLPIAIGKLQGQQDASGVFIFATYAIGLAALEAGTIGEDALVRITADETNGGVGAWYVASIGNEGLMFSFDFTTQVYNIPALTLIVLDSAGGGGGGSRTFAFFAG